MKKVLVVVAVLALTMGMASMAMAEVTVDGSIDILMRSLENTGDFDAKATNAGDYQTTLERTRIGINAKNEGVKGRVQIENDYDTWGRLETAQGNATAPAITTTCTVTSGTCDATSTSTDPGAGKLKLREAWIDFNLPFGLPGHIKVGHQLLQLGNGWFFRSQKYGSDAWVLGFPGQNTVAFVDVKALEGDSTRADDLDAYTLLDVYKIDDKNSAGAYFTRIVKRGSVDQQEGNLDTLGLHYNGVVGPVVLAAEIDLQSGQVTDNSATTDNKTKFGGNQIVIQASMPMDALTLRATLASGSGDKIDETTGSTGDKVEQFIPVLDKDLHYALVYEYFSKTAASDFVSALAAGVAPTPGAKNTGFANTQALNIGADFKVNKMITVGADIWMLNANQKVALNGGPEASKKLGNELDVKVNLTLNDQLTWNTTIGQFMPGKAYDSTDAATGDAKAADNATAIQSVLSYKF